MPEADDEQPSASETSLPQLYMRDENGEFVPVTIEPADDEDKPEERMGAFILSAQRMHVGPLPSVETFREYGEVVSDAPERILRMAEKEQDASHEFTRTAIKNERRLVSQGQWMGFATMAIALLGGIYLALHGQPWVAAALVSPAVVTAIMRFYFRGRHEGRTQEPEPSMGE